MKIAICDDDREEIKRISSILKCYNKERKIQLEYNIFSGGVELSSVAQRENYNIYILDIIMPVLNGIDLAREIREFDKVSPIIFLTSSPEFAVESYSVKAADYLVKPIDKERLFCALDDILEQRETEQDKFIIVKSDDGLRKVFLSNLMYAEVYERKIIYYLKNAEKLETTGKFSAVCDTVLKNSEFILPHRSFLVNMNFISAIGNFGIELQSGKVIPLAQRRITEIKKHYLAFQMGEVL